MASISLANYLSYSQDCLPAEALQQAAFGSHLSRKGVRGNANYEKYKETSKACSARYRAAMKELAELDPGYAQSVKERRKKYYKQEQQKMQTDSDYAQQVRAKWAESTRTRRQKQRAAKAPPT